MKKLIFMALVPLMLSACSDSFENNSTWSKSIDGDMVTVNTNSGDEYTDNATVTIESTDITKPYLNFLIEGVKFVPMMPDVTFLVSNVAWKLYASDDKNDPLYNAWIVNEKSVIPTVGGVEREEYTMHNFVGTVSDNGVTLEFDVNFGGVVYHATFGKNDALQTWEAQYSCSATVYMGSDTANATTDDLTITFFQANLSKQVATITFKDFRFVPQMPEITFTLNNVPFSFSEDGTMRMFNVASLVPEVNGEPYEQYTMTNFKGAAARNSLMLDFDLSSMQAHTSISGY